MKKEKATLSFISFFLLFSKVLINYSSMLPSILLIILCPKIFFNNFI